MKLPKPDRALAKPAPSPEYFEGRVPSLRKGFTSTRNEAWRSRPRVRMMTCRRGRATVRPSATTDPSVTRDPPELR
jgi:hypothetical protein